MPTYTAEKPVQLPSKAEIVIGDTYDGPTLQVKVDGTPVPLTGATITVKIRARKDPAATVLLTPTVTVVDSDLGKFSWSSTPAETGALTPSEAVIGIRVDWSATRKKTVAEQACSIRYGVV